VGHSACILSRAACIAEVDSRHCKVARRHLILAASICSSGVKGVKVVGGVEAAGGEGLGVVCDGSLGVCDPSEADSSAEECCVGDMTSGGGFRGLMDGNCKVVEEFW